MPELARLRYRCCASRGSKARHRSTRQGNSSFAHPRKLLCGAREKQAAARTYIKNLLLSGPLDAVQYTVAVPELADFGIDDHQYRGKYQPRSRPNQIWVEVNPHLPNPERGNEKAKDDCSEARKQQIADHMRRINSVVRLGSHDLWRRF